MRIFTLLTSLTLFLYSSNAFAGPIDPLSCFCELEGVVPDGLGLVDATDCQISEETDLVKERQGRGAFTETLSFVGGAGQACGTLQVRKYKDGKDNKFSCAVWIEQSNSSDQADCEMIIPRNMPADSANISRRGMRACQRLLDDVADQVFALPDCSAP